MRVLFLLLAALATAACETNEELVIGWVPVEPSAQISSLIASDLNEVSNYSVSSELFEDSNALTAALRDGRIDLAIIEQPDAPTMDFSALVSLYPSVLHVIAKPGMADIESDEAYLRGVIVGHSLYAGPPGSAGYTLVKRLVADGVLPEQSKFTLLDSPLGEDPDVYVVFGGILSADALRRLQGFELVGLGDVSELGKGSWVEGIAIRFPNLDPTIIPQGLYQGIGEKATLTLSVQSLLVSRPGLAEKTAYDITRRVTKKLPEIRAIYPLAGTRAAYQSNDAPLNLPRHPGAARYFERDAPGYLERYAELLAFLLTAIVALTSLTVAVVRMRRQAKKDRIDIYFDQVIELRQALDAAELDAKEASRKIKALQAKVSKLVVEERIAADSSFVAFIELSNQVLHEALGTHINC